MRRGTHGSSPTGGPDPLLRQWLTTAAMAPSVHNTQPWLFQPHGDEIDVYVDRTRQLRVIDPSARELFISVGAAVFTLRLAMLASGRLPVQRLLPLPAVADLAARVRPGLSGVQSATAAILASAISSRHSNRWPFSPLALPTETRAELIAAAAAEGAILRIADPVRRRTILGLTRAAERHWLANPHYREELRTWTTRSPGHDGVPPDATGPEVDASGPPLRDFVPARARPDRSPVTFEPTPTVAVLYAADTASCWLRTGQALQRVLLTATVRGVAATPMTQALELRELRDLLTDPTTGHPAQAILRLGYPTHSEAETRRRPLDEVLLPPPRIHRGPVGARA